MNEKRKRVVKTIYAFSVVLLALFVSVSSSFFVSNAVENYYVNYVEPSCSDTQGYVALLLENNSTGARQVNVFFWCINQVTATSSVQVGMKLNITSSSCTFSPSVSTDDINYNISVIFAEQCYTLYKGVGGNNQVFSHTYTPTGYKILGAVYKGNVAHCTSASGVARTFQIVWGSQKIELDALNSIYSELVKDYANDKVMLDKINTIMTSTASIEDKLDRLIELQEDSNDWLEKIFNKISEMLDLEGEESTEPLPDEEVDSVLQGESNLMQDTTSAENNLNFSVDSNSNNVVWNIIERVLNSNARVFGAFIGIMTLGVVTLLLNR